ncbi:hypothetical protein M0804_008011 [Polistes exclamans]|nr:hypothetical protein M0804_008011 [Polistes exclamans]
MHQGSGSGRNCRQQAGARRHCIRELAPRHALPKRTFDIRNTVITSTTVTSYRTFREKQEEEDDEEEEEIEEEDGDGLTVPFFSDER